SEIYTLSLHDALPIFFFGGRHMQDGFGPRETWQEKMKRCLSAAGGNFPPLLILDPIVARLFTDKGIDTKRKLIDWCAQNARLPRSEEHTSELQSPCNL